MPFLSNLSDTGGRLTMIKERFTIEQLDLVKTMSDQHKYIMVLYYIENLSEERIGKIMGMPTDNIKYIINHFTKSLKNKIEKEKLNNE